MLIFICAFCFYKGIHHFYFPTSIEVPSLLEVLWMIIHGRLTEYPPVINAGKLFHLYAEVSDTLRQIIPVE